MRRAIPAILVLLLASCHGERAETPAPAAPSSPVAAQSGIPATASASSPASSSPLTITFEENGARHQLVGELRDSGKRKYSLDGGPVAYEVKPGEDGGFKLRKADGSLLWKVKITPEKIKISDNEQNEHPFELKVKDANRVKVVGPGEEELGNVRYANGRIEVENATGHQILTTEAPAFSGSFGVLLLPIVGAERQILMAEIRARNR